MPLEPSKGAMATLPGVLPSALSIRPPPSPIDIQRMEWGVHTAFLESAFKLTEPALPQTPLRKESLIGPSSSTLG